MNGLYKGLIIGIPFFIAAFLGFRPGGIAQPKPAWWRWLAIASLVVLVFLSFAVPIGGSFGATDMVRKGRGETVTTPVLLTVQSIEQGRLTGVDDNGRAESVGTGEMSQSELSDIRSGDRLILHVHKGSEPYSATEVTWVNPVLTLPLLPQLLERARNLYYHVPCAWLAQLAWIVAAIFAVRYLRRQRVEDDIIASSAAAVGGLFCILATLTGAIWARFDWGSFWNWDPRQVAIFVVLVIYGAYFALRSAIPSMEDRARVSSIYLLLLLLPIAFFLFGFPKLMGGLHVDAKGSGSVGPVLDPSDNALNPTKQVITSLGFFAFTLLYYWMVNLSARMRLLALDRKRRYFGTADEHGATGSSAIV